MSRLLTRRGFLRAGITGAATAVLAGCQNAPAWVTLEPYVQPPEEQVSGDATWYASTCRQCPAGCGIIVRIINGRAVKIEGNPQHPVNQGKLCARGQASLQFLYHPDRLQTAVTQSQRGSRNFTPVDWNEGINTLSQKMKAAGSKVAVWCGASMSGHLYQTFSLINKAIGAPAPLVYDNDVAFGNHLALRNADRALLGSNALPIYNIDTADVIFSFSADIFGPWLSDVRYGMLYGAFRSRPLGLRGYMVQLEPRMTVTGSRADRWVPLQPGSEGMVAQAIIRLIADQGMGPAERVARAKSMAATVDVNAAAAAAGVSAAELAELARIFATAQHPLAIPGAGLAGQDKGNDATTMVQALNLIAGNVGDNGGLSLAPSSPSAAAEPTVSSYTDAQALIQHMNAGDVQVLLVYGANPAFELAPQAGYMQALAKVPFITSFASIIDETAAQADLVLPDRMALESWGYIVPSPNYTTPAVGSMQPVVTPLYDNRATGDVMLAVAATIPAAAQALPFANEVDMLKSTVAKLPVAPGQGSGAEVLWAHFLQQGGWWPEQKPAAPAATAAAPAPINLGATTLQGDAGGFPYILQPYMTSLISGGQGAALPWLQGVPDTMTSVSWQTWVQISPETAAKLGVTYSDVVTVTSPFGQIQAPVYIYPGMRSDVVAIPIGQGHTDLGRYARGYGVNTMQLLGAEAGASGTNAQWATVRVKLEKTGQKDILATFEYIPGLDQGGAPVPNPVP